MNNPLHFQFLEYNEQEQKQQRGAEVLQNTNKDRKDENEEKINFNERKDKIEKDYEIDNENDKCKDNRIEERKETEGQRGVKILRNSKIDGSDEDKNMNVNNRKDKNQEDFIIDKFKDKNKDESVILEEKE